ncbi:hypothetical protein [Pedobacter sp. ASV12]|uniref:hypothetical protein n=1 Tax=Pedobacter sp. ASV12 TaxID=2795120 RepID=UPI0018EE2E73|nr:hypothetical protein [Pedobacter sp. ASV12]
MKKFIQITGILTIAVVTFFSCKKEKTEQKEEERFSVAMKVVTAQTTENAVIIGTKAELKAALAAKEGPVYLKKIAKTNNLFIPIVGEGSGPSNPMLPCNQEIDAYVNAHQAEWQQQANQTCTTVMVCVTCPNAGGGLYVMYIIKPTSPRCAIALPFEQQFKLAAFNFGNDQLESEAVASFIKNN